MNQDRKSVRDLEKRKKRNEVRGTERGRERKIE